MDFPYARLVPLEGTPSRELGFLPELAALGDVVLEPLEDLEIDAYEADL